MGIMYTLHFSPIQGLKRKKRPFQKALKTFAQEQFITQSITWSVTRYSTQSVVFFVILEFKKENIINVKHWRKKDQNLSERNTRYFGV